MSYPLSLIFKKSLTQGILPSDWKMADVTAIYKKGPKSHRGNYRPVSLTSVCCKILEQLIREEIIIIIIILFAREQYSKQVQMTVEMSRTIRRKDTHLQMPFIQKHRQLVSSSS